MARESPQPPVIASGPRCRWHILLPHTRRAKNPPITPVLSTRAVVKALKPTAAALLTGSASTERQTHYLNPFAKAGEAAVGPALCRQEGDDSGTPETVRRAWRTTRRGAGCIKMI